MREIADREYSSVSVADEPQLFDLYQIAAKNLPGFVVTKKETDGNKFPGVSNRGKIVFSIVNQECGRVFPIWGEVDPLIRAHSEALQRSKA